MKPAIVRLLVACLFVTACSSVLGPGERERLQKAEEQWNSLGVTEYSFEMRTSCFCGPEVYEWAVVDVKNGAVVSARSLSGAPLTGYAVESRKSVEQLFEIARKYRPDWVSKIDVEFDADLGYPTTVSITSKPNIADAGATYEARNLQIRVRTK